MATDQQTVYKHKDMRAGHEYPSNVHAALADHIQSWLTKPRTDIPQATAFGYLNPYSTYWAQRGHAKTEEQELLIEKLAAVAALRAALSDQNENFDIEDVFVKAQARHNAMKALYGFRAYHAHVASPREFYKGYLGTYRDIRLTEDLAMQKVEALRQPWRAYDTVHNLYMTQNPKRAETKEALTQLRGWLWSELQAIYQPLFVTETQAARELSKFKAASSKTEGVFLDYMHKHSGLHHLPPTHESSKLHCPPVWHENA